MINSFQSAFQIAFQSAFQSAWLWERFLASSLGQLQEQSAQEAIQGVLQSTGMLLLVAGALLLVVVLLRFAAQMDALPKTPLKSPSHDNNHDQPLRASVVLEPQPYQSVSVRWSIPTSVTHTFSNNDRHALMIRLLDVTYIDLAHQQPHTIYDYPCEWNDSHSPCVMGIAVPEGDRDYIAELGYHSDGQWCQLARSSHVRVQKA